MGYTNKKKHNNFLVQGSILAIASLLSRVIGLLYRVPMTNIIGDEGMGYYNIAFQIYNLALILSSYSMPLAVSKLVAAYSVKREHRSSYRVFKAAMLLACISGFVASVIIYFGSDYFATVIFKSPRSAIPLRVLSPTIFVVAIIGVLRGFYQGKNTMLPTSVSQLLEQIINGMVSILAASAFMVANSASYGIAAYGAAGGTLGTFAGAVSALIFLSLVFYAYRPIIYKQMRRDTLSEVEDYSKVYHLLFMTIAPVILSQTVYQLSGIVDNALFGNIMHAKGVTPEVHSALLGIYSSKYNLLVNVPISIASAIAASMVPSIVRARVKGSSRDVKKKVAVAIKFNMIIAIPAAVGMAVLARPIMNLLFYTKDANSTNIAVNLLVYGSVSIVFYALSTISNAVLQGINHMSIPVRHSAISLGIHIIIVTILLKFTNLGVYALVIGNVTFPLVVCILNWISIGRLLKYHQEIVQSFCKPIIASFGMGVVAIILYKALYFLTHSNAVATILAVLFGMLTYFINLVVLKGISEEELDYVPKGQLIIRYCKKFKIL